MGVLALNWGDYFQFLANTPGRLVHLESIIRLKGIDFIWFRDGKMAGLHFKRLFACPLPILMFAISPGSFSHASFAWRGPKTPKFLMCYRNRLQLLGSIGISKQIHRYMYRFWSTVLILQKYERFLICSFLRYSSRRTLIKTDVEFNFTCRDGCM